MASSSRRVVITGIGALTPIGLDAPTYFKALLAGKSGVRAIRSFDASSLPVRIAGEIDHFDAKAYVDKQARKGLRMMARTIQLAVACAQVALDEGKVDKSKLDPTRFGVEFGAGLIATELPEFAEAARHTANCQPGVVDMEKWGGEGLEMIQPLFMLKYLPNMPACHISILHDAQGPNNSITENDVSGLLALAEASRILTRGDADFFLVGGAESRINPISLVRQCLFESVSSRNDDPERACRPFDRARDGVVLGEGACVFVVEELEHAKKRGARVYAEVVGNGAAFDRKMSGDGLARAMRAALAEAGIGPEDVDHVNAHGLSTRAADVMEASALRQVFGDRDVPVVAYKSALGNLGAGGNTTELAASVLALSEGVLPPTRNYDEPDPECPVRAHTGAPRPVQKPYVLKTSFTTMGQCAAAVVRKWD
jgi:3-oxoacyl-[acyl-carrier-protein] synthase II